MKLKIDAPIAYVQRMTQSVDTDWYGDIRWYRLDDDYKPCRIIRESDWRRIMAVVRAADVLEQTPFLRASDIFPLEESLNDLRAHLAKRRK